MNFSPCTKGRGWRVFRCRRNGECWGNVCPCGSETARCRRAAASPEESPTPAPEEKLMKGRIATFWFRRFAFERREAEVNLSVFLKLPN